MAARQDAVIRQIPHLRRYARVLTGDDGEADDLTQDTLERALVRLDQWRDSADSPCKWMLSILHNLYVDSQRRNARRPLHVGLESVDDAPAGAVDGVSGCDVDRALQRLSVGQRQVLLLVGVQGLTYAEAADVLDIPIGTVMSRLARGRDRLRMLMAHTGAP